MKIMEGLDPVQVRSIFRQLGALSPADEAVRKTLEAKLEDYRSKIDMYSLDKEAFLHEPSLRDATYKFAILDAVLRATEDVSLLSLMKVQMKGRGKAFDPWEFYCAVTFIATKHLWVRLPTFRIGPAMASAT